MSLRICRSLTVVIGFIVAAVGLLLGFYVFPKVLNEKIDDTMKLVNGSDAYERWVKLPIPLQFKVYFFNVTNADEVQLGAKPKVKEVGPYVYNQFRQKHDIVKDDDDNLSYNQTQLFYFNKVASQQNDENDVITVAHLPLMVISTMADKPLLSGALNRSIPILFDNPKNVFLTTKVKDFVFDGINIACDKQINGIVKRVCKEIDKQRPAQLKKLKDGRFQFSLLSYKNNTHDGRYKINSGYKDISSLGEIYAWNNSSTLNVWQPNSTCNNIYGTDTTIFPPHRTQLSKVNVFQSDICRSVNLHYNSDSEYKGIKTIKYVVGGDMLLSGANYSSNQCFCLNKTKGITGDDGCLLDGALELWNCQNVPIVITFPHFYLAHEKYKSTIDGLSPNKSKHEIFVELEPKSGTVLRGSKRIQFNIFFRRIENVDLTNDLVDSLMPVFWIDEGVELDDDNVNLLYNSLFYPMKIMDIVYWSLIGLGLTVGLIGMVWCMLFAHKPKHLF